MSQWLERGFEALTPCAQNLSATFLLSNIGPHCFHFLQLWCPFRFRRPLCEIAITELGVGLIVEVK